MNRAILVSILFSSASVMAQHSDSDRLRDLIKTVPQLPVERVEIKINPPLTLEGISAVTADKHGNIYVIHRPANGDPVVVLDAKGSLLRSWGKGMFKLPHGIRIDPHGNVWTVDAHTSMVYKFTPAGKKLLEINVGGVPDPSQEFCGATDIAFAKNGHVFVADGYCNARVIEYDAEGRKVREWGKPGIGPGEFNVVHAIAVAPQGNVYVADRENGRVQWFSPKGKFLGQWTYGGQLYTVALARLGNSTSPRIRREYRWTLNSTWSDRPNQRQNAGTLRSARARTRRCSRRRAIASYQGQPVAVVSASQMNAEAAD